MLAVACSSENQSGTEDAGGDAGHDADGHRDAIPIEPLGDGAPTYAPTYTAVYAEVLAPTCAVVFCHSGMSDYLLISNQDEGYSALVNAPATGPKCAPTGLKRVDPGHPETSLLYLKVTNPPCGDRMPYMLGTLDPQPIEQIREWIEAGAPNN